MQWREQYWFPAAILTLAVEYGLIWFGYPPRAGRILAMLVGPGIVATVLSVTAPAGRSKGLVGILLVCVIVLRQPLGEALDAGAGWMAALILYGIPFGALLFAARRAPEVRPPRSVTFARTLTIYLVAQTAACVLLLVYALIFSPRIG